MCNINPREIRRRRNYAIASGLFALLSLLTIITANNLLALPAFFFFLFIMFLNFFQVIFKFCALFAMVGVDSSSGEYKRVSRAIYIQSLLHVVKLVVLSLICSIIVTFLLIGGIDIFIDSL